MQNYTCPLKLYKLRQNMTCHLGKLFVPNITISFIPSFLGIITYASIDNYTLTTSLVFSCEKSSS